MNPLHPTNPVPPSDGAEERLLDLLTAQATCGLSPEESAELHRLLAEAPGEGADAFELAAAAADLAFIGTLEVMPGAIAARTLDAVRAAAAPEGVAAPLQMRAFGPASAGRSRRWAVAGWVAAAACLAIAFVGWWPTIHRPVSQADLASRAEAFAKSTPDVVRLAWGDFNDIATKAPPEVPGVKGEVIWSDSEQKGYMKLTGLPVNDPRREQYQLWIVDAERGLQQRISGAIFDVPAGSASGGPTTVVVPIEPGLHVGKAQLFAVTIEKPGGVWVSDMSRRACLAANTQ